MTVRTKIMNAVYIFARRLFTKSWAHPDGGAEASLKRGSVRSMCVIMYVCGYVISRKSSPQTPTPPNHNKRFFFFHALPQQHALLFN